MCRLGGAPAGEQGQEPSDGRRHRGRIRLPRTNSIIERWVQTCRYELLDRTLIWNQAMTVLREGPERARIYATLVQYWPDLLQYQTHTTRTFPVILLDPTQ